MIRSNTKLIKITPHLFVDESEIKFVHIRSPGPGGQNVNKVATGIQLHFDVVHSASLPEETRSRLILLLGKKISNQGELIIKATRFRTQEKNKHDAINRLIEIIRPATIIPKKRKKTKPSKAAQQERLTQKKLHGKIKSLRKNKINFND